jgi:arylsulfatase A-like enzyme
MYIPVLAPHGPYEADNTWRQRCKSFNMDTSSEACAWAAMVMMLDDFIGNIVMALKKHGECNGNGACIEEHMFCWCFTVRAIF